MPALVDYPRVISLKYGVATQQLHFFVKLLILLLLCEKYDAKYYLGISGMILLFRQPRLFKFSASLEVEAARNLRLF